LKSLRRKRTKAAVFGSYFYPYPDHPDYPDQISVYAGFRGPLPGQKLGSPRTTRTKGRRVPAMPLDIERGRAGRRLDGCLDPTTPRPWMVPLALTHAITSARYSEGSRRPPKAKSQPGPYLRLAFAFPRASHVPSPWLKYPLHFPSSNCYQIIQSNRPPLPGYDLVLTEALFL
jgi:hypothetical protein